MESGYDGVSDYTRTTTIKPSSDDGDDLFPKSDRLKELEEQSDQAHAHEDISKYWTSSTTSTTSTSIPPPVFESKIKKQTQVQQTSSSNTNTVWNWKDKVKEVVNKGSFKPRPWPWSSKT